MFCGCFADVLRTFTVKGVKVLQGVDGLDCGPVVVRLWSGYGPLVGLWLL